MELHNGKWIPRRLPPNLGAPRDLPDYAVIHPSVKEMIKAGILDKDSVPPSGGDNPNLPNVANVAYAWTKLRNNMTKQASQTNGPANGSADGSEKTNGTGNKWTLAKAWG